MEPFFDDYIKKLAKEENYKELLLNLLAVLNSDGGHYTEEHGIAKSVLNGIKNFYERS